MPIDHDIQVTGTDLRFLPIKTRVPLKFGAETLDSVTCARARVQVLKKNGTSAEGWGETPLSVQWVWPSRISYDERLGALKAFSEVLLRTFNSELGSGHAMEIGHEFVFKKVPKMLLHFNKKNRKNTLKVDLEKAK